MANGFTIEPLAIDLSLPEGAEIESEITVTIAKQTQDAKLDVYFLADTTNSMGGMLTLVQSRAIQILTALRGPGLDVAFGVGNYKDFAPGETPFQHQLAPTIDTSAASAAIA